MISSLHLIKKSTFDTVKKNLFQHFIAHLYRIINDTNVYCPQSLAVFIIMSSHIVNFLSYNEVNFLFIQFLSLHNYFVYNANTNKQKAHSQNVY